MGSINPISPDFSGSHGREQRIADAHAHQRPRKPPHTSEEDLIVDIVELSPEALAAAHRDDQD